MKFYLEDNKTDNKIWGVSANLSLYLLHDKVHENTGGMARHLELNPRHDVAHDSVPRTWQGRRLYP